jgi:quercetin dioxygenase-like cupin family protein
MNAPGPVVVDLLEMTQVANQGIVSKSVVENDHHKIIHFTLAPGQELSEHAASVPAVIQVIAGSGTVTLAGRRHKASAGKLYYMPAHLKHGVVADDTLVFLLTMFRT